jgi:hypothetical protein
MQGGVETAKPVINNRINRGYGVLVVHCLQTFFETAITIGIKLLRSSRTDGFSRLYHPNHIHPSGNIDITVSAPMPEIATEIIH